MLRLALVVSLLLGGCATAPRLDLDVWPIYPEVSSRPIPPVFGCAPTHTNPDGIPDGGCI